jgi:predicted  nucleic acid-binding Zn-ribbon protein
MPTAADSLRELHHLHQRAKALKERLASAPKTLAARQGALAGRQSELDEAKKALQDLKVQLKTHEHALQGIETKIDELRTKLNLVRKNEEYKAFQNQIAHDNLAKGKIEEQILLAYEEIESKAAEVARLDADVKRFCADVAALSQQVEADAAAHNQQLQNIETAIVEAEATAIPEKERDRYRRIIARYGADALAACEEGACLGCFTALTAQMVNDLINGGTLCFCLSCGRLLYLTEPEIANTRRTVETKMTYPGPLPRGGATS